jgi:hypothetical protein
MKYTIENELNILIVLFLSLWNKILLNMASSLCIYILVSGI